MRCGFTIAGATLLVAGGVMVLLLESLGQETFRVDLPPWFYLAYATMGAGLVVLGTGVVAKSSKPATAGLGEASRYFLHFAMLNAAAAAAFALPVLDPALEFPILITRWPGIYMVLGYTFFVVVGVLGNAAWAFVLRTLGSDLAAGMLRRGPLLIQLVLAEAGVFGLAVFMFLGGYVGASLDYGGGGATMVGISMEFAVIPSALSIFGLVVATLIGLGNTWLALRGSWRKL